MKNNNTCIAIVQYSTLDNLPPVMTLMKILMSFGLKVHFVGIESSAGRAFLNEHGISFDFLSYPSHPNRINRLLTFLRRRNKLLSILKGLSVEYKTVIPWFQECHSAALAGNEAFKYKRCITTFFEYESNYGRRWLGFNFERMIHENVIVECEINRAYLTQANHGLERTPFVITNKPLLDAKCLPALNQEARSVFEKIGNRPVFLYQGDLAGDRKDVPFILETIAKNRPEYCVLLLVGYNGLSHNLSKYPNAYLLNRIPAPGHLAVTAKATVGIACYSGVGSGSWYTNAIYCAPNKIYEYAAFGVPTLGNRIPGLEYSIERAKAGLCCDMTEESVLRTADELVKNISFYRDNAFRFYRETDVEGQVRAVLKAVGV